MKYTIYWCDNEKCSNRGCFDVEDSFFEDVYEFNSDRDAFMKAIEITNNDFDGLDDYEDFEDYDADELANELGSTDIGDGSPVIFWIERDGQRIYDTGFTKEAWLNNFEDF